MSHEIFRRIDCESFGARKKDGQRAFESPRHENKRRNRAYLSEQSVDGDELDETLESVDSVPDLGS